MLYYINPGYAQKCFQALSSTSRLDILNLLSSDGELSLVEIAGRLGMANATVSQHIDLLEECGLIRVRIVPGAHGRKRLCSIKEDKLVVELNNPYESEHFIVKEASVPIGHYTDYSISPTCLIATPTGLVGGLDDIRVFSYPERYQAGMLCFGHGYIQYNLTNLLEPEETISEIQLSFEASSEAPGINENFPSDIYFSINGIKLGHFTLPGDFGDRRGGLNPGWYPREFNQYGFLKFLIINESGTFIDGHTKISDVTLRALSLTSQSLINFRLDSPIDCQNPGGLALFGSTFGDYQQDILFRMLIKK